MKPILDASLPTAPGDARAELRAELAASAARMIAESALDYQSAKQKALRRAFGATQPPAGLVPSNEEVDQALREHLELFDPDHAERVGQYREAGLVWLQRLADYHPYLCGAAWKGVIAPHTPLHIQCFTDDAKELEFRLLDAGIQYDVADVAHFSGRHDDVPALIFHDRNELPVMISVYPHDDLRGALKGQHAQERGDIHALQKLLDDSSAPPPRA